MKLITYERRMAHIAGPDHDWWQPGTTRVRDETSPELTYILDSSLYRNVAIQDDPHDHHTAADIETSTSGMASRCTVPGCTWSWDYD